jgi:comEA protein
MAKHEKIILLIAAAVVLFVSGFWLGGRLSSGNVSITVEKIPDPVYAAGASATASPPPETAAVIVNINTATADELAELDGIGSTLAERIVAYRETNGAFRVPEQLMNVEGIGEIKFNSIKNYITVN